MERRISLKASAGIDVRLKVSCLSEEEAEMRRVRRVASFLVILLSERLT